MFLAVLLAVAKKWMQLKCTLKDEWVYNMWHDYTIEYYTALKRKEVLAHATTSVNLKSNMPSEINDKKTNTV